jgi:hypothetical protein
MRYFLCFLIISIITGCNGYQYVSTPVYVPMNNEKGDLKASISGNNINVGYALSSNISLFSNGYSRNSIKGINSETMLSQENSGISVRSDTSYECNIGMSYFFKKSFLRFEVLLGTGFGKMRYSNNLDLFPNNYQFHMAASKYDCFVQPYVGYRFRNLFDCGIFSKISYYSYFDIKSSVNIGMQGTTIKEDRYDDFFTNKRQVDLYFLEPGIFFRIGTQHVKFQTTLSNVINLNNEDFYYRDINLKFSIFMDINIKKQKTLPNTQYSK